MMHLYRFWVLLENAFLCVVIKDAVPGYEYEKVKGEKCIKLRDKAYSWNFFNKSDWTIFFFNCFSIRTMSLMYYLERTYSTIHFGTTNIKNTNHLVHTHTHTNTTYTYGREATLDKIFLSWMHVVGIYTDKKSFSAHHISSWLNVDS